MPAPTATVDIYPKHGPSRPVQVVEVLSFDRTRSWQPCARVRLSSGAIQTARMVDVEVKR